MQVDNQFAISLKKTSEGLCSILYIRPGELVRPDVGFYSTSTVIMKKDKDKNIYSKDGDEQITGMYKMKSEEISENYDRHDFD